MTRSAKPGRSDAERLRQKALRAFDLEEARPTFERIARLAQAIAGTPIGQVSMIQADRLWRAGIGLPSVPEVERRHAFSEWAVKGDGVLWVEDLSADPRFADNPYVSGEQRLRFYAGAPITVADGGRVGALSVIDQRPHPFDAQVAAQLQDLAALVADEWDRRLALRDLARGEARAQAAHNVLAAIVDNAPVALLMTDRNLRVLRASPRFREETGLAEGPIVGRTMFDLFPNARERYGADYARALKGETVRADRVRVGLADGRETWVRAELTPWRDHRGRVGGLLIMSHDISDMVGALERSSRSEQTLKLAIEIGQLSMWELDHGRKELNEVGGPAFETASSMDYDLMANNVWDGVHPHDREAAMAEWERHLREGTPYRATCRMMRLDGPHVWVQIAAEGLRGEDGEVERVVGVIRNIDKERRGEIALAKARDAAEAANRAKSEFLANMSHEIRTPLNGVMGVASALGHTALSPGQMEMVGLIESSAQTLESLLSDVLDLARIESGRLALEQEPFDLRRAVHDVAALFEPSARAKGLAFAVETAPETEGTFLGDAARIRQILSNLVSNAVKFTSRGQVRISASALRTPEGIEARVTVRDTGIGFDEETRSRLFGRFEQADGSITRRFGGSGLGLAISRSLAVQMGGEISAVSAPGEGATFRFSASLTRGEDARAGAALAPAAHSERPVGGDFKVLLAEDHPTNRRVVELILQAAGVDLTSVENGALAVEAWQTGAFDLVLMDMQMPVMDGLTAMAEIRAREAAQGRARTAMFALTANAMPEHSKASRDAGADGHLTKPISADDLFRVVEQVADGTYGSACAPMRQSA
ncbi:MAG: ATP-binding protein [Caulobacterales bacterium]